MKKGPQDSESQHAETASQEAEEEEAVHERPEEDRPTNGGTDEETEKHGDENPSCEGKEDGEGETPVLDEVVEGATPIMDSMIEGETPIVNNVAEGETPLETGDETPIDFRGGPLSS